MEKMIPKKIHWCWFSGEPVPGNVQECINTWKTHLPDCQIVLWDREAIKNIPLPDVIAEALKLEKWAVVSDFIRLHAVYTQGGIYFDSDVIVAKPIPNDILEQDFFTSIEYFAPAFTGLQAAIFGAKPEHPFLRDCTDYYFAPGDEYDKILNSEIIAPHIWKEAAKRCGLEDKDEMQTLGGGMAVYPHDVFAGFHDQVTENTIAWHICHGSWRKKEDKRIRVMIAIPCVGYVETDCWVSVLNMERPSNVGAVINTFSRYSAAQSRNMAVKSAIAQGFDYILFIDSDQIVPQDTLIKLLAMGCDMAVGWTMMNLGKPETNVAVYDKERLCFDFYTRASLPKEAFEPGGCGFACNLIKLDIFKDLSYPYFVYTEYGNGEILSEDLYFSLQLKQAGKKILCDPSLQIGHIKRIVI